MAFKVTTTINSFYFNKNIDKQHCFPFNIDINKTKKSKFA